MVARPIVVTPARNPIPIPNPIWLTANLLAGPLLALFFVPSLLTGVVASSRLTDPRAVQQVAALMAVPIVLLGAAQVTGLFLISLPMILPMTLLGALLMALLDGAVLWLTVRLFQREIILTRWR